MSNQHANNKTNTNTNTKHNLYDNNTTVPRHIQFHNSSRLDDSNCGARSSSNKISVSSTSLGSEKSIVYHNINFRNNIDLKSNFGSEEQRHSFQCQQDIAMGGFPLLITAAATHIGRQKMTVDKHGKNYNKKPNLIDKPLDNDIVSGRGHGANRHPGNIRFREIVTKYKDMYLHAKAANKKLIARKVVKEVEAMNPQARFLQQDEKTGMWTVLERRKTLRKVAQALREPSLKNQKCSELFSDFSAELRSEQYREELANWKPCGSAAKTDIISDVREKNSSEFIGRSEEGPSSTRHNDKHTGVIKLQERPKCYQNSSQDIMYFASQPLTGLSCALTTINNPNPVANGANLVHSNNIHGPFTYPYLDKDIHRGTTQFPGQSEISMPYILNYGNMSIVSTQKIPRTSIDENDYETETLKNISIVASTCSDLTALYLIIRTGAISFTSYLLKAPSHDVTITPYDVLINAFDIHNHPGNLNIAESVQLSYKNYMNAQLDGGNAKSNIINNVISSVTKENDYKLSVSQHRRAGRFLLFSPPEAWIVLPKKNVAALVESLLQQACTFILHPDTNDVLFDRQGISRLWPGNMYFKSMINEYKLAYTHASPEIKLDYAVKIIGTVTSRPGRFLGNIEEMGMWAPLSFNYTIDKIQKHLSGDEFG